MAVEQPPLTLYRVGDPSIGETWPRRFRHTRSTGGLGSGIFAFRDRSAAKRNESGEWTNDGLFELRDALSSPIQPRTRDATDNLVRLSRALALLSKQVNRTDYTFEDAKTTFRESGLLLYTLTGSLGGDPGVGTDDASTSYGSTARDVLFNTPELRERYGFDTDEFVLDAIEATGRAHERALAAERRYYDAAVPQPINELLWPDYDGVAPLDGAGGNMGMHGCLVFKQKVDQCLGRTTESKETVSAERLNACWG